MTLSWHGTMACLHNVAPKLVFIHNLVVHVIICYAHFSIASASTLQALGNKFGRLGARRKTVVPVSLLVFTINCAKTSTVHIAFEDFSRQSHV